MDRFRARFPKHEHLLIPPVIRELSRSLAPGGTDLDHLPEDVFEKIEILLDMKIPTAYKRSQSEGLPILLKRKRKVQRRLSAGQSPLHPGELLPRGPKRVGERSESVFGRQKLKKARRRLQSSGGVPRSTRAVAPRDFSWDKHGHEDLSEYGEPSGYDVFDAPSRDPWTPTTETTLNRSMSLPEGAQRVGAQRVGQRFASVGSDPTGRFPFRQRALTPTAGDPGPDPRGWKPEDRNVDRARSLSVKGTPQRERARRRVVSESAADALRKGRQAPRQFPQKMEAAGSGGPPKGPPPPPPGALK